MIGTEPEYASDVGCCQWVTAVHCHWQWQVQVGRGGKAAGWSLSVLRRVLQAVNPAHQLEKEVTLEGKRDGLGWPWTRFPKPVPKRAGGFKTSTCQ
jgi:hypothetical protein